MEKDISENLWIYICDIDKWFTIEPTFQKTKSRRIMSIEIPLSVSTLKQLSVTESA